MATIFAPWRRPSWSSSRRLLIPYLAAAALLLPSSAAADFRIATVDVGRILNESQDAKIRRNEIEAKANEARKKIATKKKSLEELESKLKQGGASEGSKDAESFRASAREYNRFVNDTEQDLKEQFVRVNRSLTENALKVIRKYAEERQIDLVLDKSSRERGPVLFGVPNADITDEVIKRIDG